MENRTKNKFELGVFGPIGSTWKTKSFQVLGLLQEQMQKLYVCIHAYTHTHTVSEFKPNHSLHHTTFQRTLDFRVSL